MSFIISMLYFIQLFSNHHASLNQFRWIFFIIVNSFVKQVIHPYIRARARTYTH